MKEPQKVDMHIFRENTEDIYAGIEWEAGTPEAEKFYRFLHDEMGVAKVRFPESSSFGVKPVSRKERNVWYVRHVNMLWSMACRQ